MAVQRLCQACGKPNPEQARFCEDCGTALQEDATVATSEVKPAPYTSTYHYTSTYQTARTTAQFISGVGWIVFAFSALMLVMSFLALISSERGSVGSIAGLLSLPSLGGAIAGLLLVAVGQFTRAAVDTADFTGEMLAIMKATWLSGR